MVRLTDDVRNTCKSVHNVQIVQNIKVNIKSDSHSVSGPLNYNTAFWAVLLPRSAEGQLRRGFSFHQTIFERDCPLWLRPHVLGSQKGWVARIFGQKGSRISWRHRGGRERRRPGGKSSTIRNWFAKAELSRAITQSEDFLLDPGLLLISQPQRDGTVMTMML